MILLSFFFYISIFFSVMTDLYDKSVYTFISLLVFILGLIINFLDNSWFGLCEGIVNGLFGYLLFLFLYYCVLFLKKEEGIGLGDAEFMLGLSTQLEFKETLLVFVYAAYISSIVGLIYALITKKKIRGIELPLVPFLFLGFLIIKEQIFLI